MKKKVLPSLFAFCLALPLVFSVFVFGYLPMKFDVIVYPGEVVGEGTCSIYLTQEQTTFAYLYQRDAYFGSELKTLRLPGFQMNVESVELKIYDVDEVDIRSFDISVFGITVAHINKDGLTHPFTRTLRTAVASDEEPLLHLSKDDEEFVTVIFPGSSVIPPVIWVAYFAGIVLLSVLLALLLLVLFDKAPAIRIPFISIICILVTVIMGCFLCGSLPYVSYTYLLLNTLLLFAAALLLGSLTLPWIGTAAVSLFTMFWYIANFFVIRFRGKPVMPADLKALGTAEEVLSGYDLTPNWKMVVSVLVVLAFLSMLFVVWRRSKPGEKAPLPRRLARRAAGVLSALVLAFLCVNNPAFSQLNKFQWDVYLLEGFHREGIVLTYIKSAMSGHVKRPEGYSREAVNTYLAEYQTQSAAEGVQPTRIIMIMNEAFSDLRTVGLDNRVDVMPFVDSLDKNTMEGRLYVSVLGGGTCNTEFEALTGNSLAFLGPGAYPYTENVTKPLFSLASYFNSQNYLSEAFHANKAQNWNRDKVYPNLGFQVFHSIQDYPELTLENYLHSQVKDATDYDFIEQVDSTSAGQPRFLFNVTMQNHAFYDHFEDLQEAETLVPFEDSLHQSVRVYLSLIKASDEAVRDLMEHYKDSEEPTMIIFFGDHQPLLSDAALKTVYTKAQNNLDYFNSKFFIWTNYETETVHDAAISANFLPWLILERGHFPLPPYVQMLKEVHDKYPIISSQGVVDAEGNVYDNVAQLLDDPLIQKYQNIQYANLFDELDPAWFALG